MFEPYYSRLTGQQLRGIKKKITPKMYGQHIATKGKKKRKRVKK